MACRKPQARNEEPHDVAEGSHRAKGPHLHGFATEREDHVVGDAEARNAERDRDNENAREDTREDVAKPQPKAGGKNPNNVENDVDDGAHTTNVLPETKECEGRPGQRAAALASAVRGIERKPRIRLVSETIAKVAAHDFNTPHPDDVARRLLGHRRTQKRTLGARPLPSHREPARLD